MKERTTLAYAAQSDKDGPIQDTSMRSGNAGLILRATPVEIARRRAVGIERRYAPHNE